MNSVLVAGIRSMQSSGDERAMPTSLASSSGPLVRDRRTLPKTVLQGLCLLGYHIRKRYLSVTANFN